MKIKLAFVTILALFFAVQSTSLSSSEIHTRGLNLYKEHFLINNHSQCFDEAVKSVETCNSKTKTCNSKTKTCSIENDFKQAREFSLKVRLNLILASRLMLLYEALYEAPEILNELHFWESFKWDLLKRKSWESAAANAESFYENEKIFSSWNMRNETLTPEFSECFSYMMAQKLHLPPHSEDYYTLLFRYNGNVLYIYTISNGLFIRLPLCYYGGRSA